MSTEAWNYVSGGAADESTLRDATAAWQRMRLLPQVLHDVGHLDTSTTVVGHECAHPIVVAPTARHRWYHESGEYGMWQGSADAESIFTLSSLSSTPLAEFTAAIDTKQPWWFQLYVQKDRGWTRDLVTAACDQGATALIVTVDTPTLGARDRDKRDNLGASQGTVFPILESAPLRPDPTAPHRRVYNPHLSPDLTWADLEWLVAESPVPVVPKGVVRAADAQRCAKIGCAGVVVSNHGARNLDTVVTTADALRGIVRAVRDAGHTRDAFSVLCDGGVRRGTDIAKAVALGADAVLVGRPTIWGLASYGPAGVTHVIEMLRTELEMAMALLGATRLADLTPDHVIASPTEV